MNEAEKLRKRIDAARKELTRAEAIEQATEGEIEETLGAIREALKCKPGGEKDALKKLRSQLEADGQRISALLEEAEEIRRQAEEADGE